MNGRPIAAAIALAAATFAWSAFSGSGNAVALSEVKLPAMTKASMHYTTRARSAEEQQE